MNFGHSTASSNVIKHNGVILAIHMHQRIHHTIHIIFAILIIDKRPGILLVCFVHELLLDTHQIYNVYIVVVNYQASTAHFRFNIAESISQQLQRKSRCKQKRFPWC